MTFHLNRVPFLPCIHAKVTSHTLPDKIFIRLLTASFAFSFRFSFQILLSPQALHIILLCLLAHRLVNSASLSTQGVCSQARAGAHGLQPRPLHSPSRCGPAPLRLALRIRFLFLDSGNLVTPSAKHEASNICLSFINNLGLHIQLRLGELVVSAPPLTRACTQPAPSPPGAAPQVWDALPSPRCGEQLSELRP